MREWFVAQELAGLPRMPQTPSAVLRRARAQRWQARERDGRGGGREYHVSALPASTRLALLAREQSAAPIARAASIEDVDTSGRHAELWAGFAQKPDSIRAEATRRVAALHALQQLIAEGQLRTEAYAALATQLDVTTSTVRNWWRLVEHEPPTLWAPLLCPKWAGCTTSVSYDDRLYSMFRDLYLDLSRPPMRTCYERVKRWAASEQLVMPSYATMVRELKRREHPDVVRLEREGERALAASYPSLERDRTGLYAMQFVNSDGHILDLDTVWPDGERVRTTLLTVQDVYSSAIVGWRLVKSENAHEMRLTFLDTFRQFGIPARLFIDNTLAAAAKQNTAGARGRKRFRDKPDDPIGVLPLLGVQVTFVTPAHGQAKPIERSFGTLTSLIAKHPSFSGAYLGNSPVNKPANYGARTITLDELRPIVAQEIHAYNTQLGRRGGVANGASYQTIFTRSFEASTHLIPRLTAEQSRLLYLVAERVRVDRREGFVKLFKNRYYSEAVGRLRGTDVVVRYNPDDLHASVWIYRLDGTLVGEAPAIHKAGFADAAAAERISRARGQLKRTTKDQARAQRRLTAAQVAAMIPANPEPPLAAIAAQQTTTRRADFALPQTAEQLGRQAAAAHHRAATEQVSTAIAKLADTVLEPKRKRA